MPTKRIVTERSCLTAETILQVWGMNKGLVKCKAGRSASSHPVGGSRETGERAAGRERRKASGDTDWKVKPRSINP